MYLYQISKLKYDFTMSSLRDTIAEMIHQLPDETTIEDIQYHLYVLEKINKGQKQIKGSNGISNEEAKARLSKWLTK